MFIQCSILMLNQRWKSLVVATYILNVTPLWTTSMCLLVTYSSYEYVQIYVVRTTSSLTHDFLSHTSGLLCRKYNVHHIVRTTYYLVRACFVVHTTNIILYVHVLSYVRLIILYIHVLSYVRLIILYVHVLSYMYARLIIPDTHNLLILSHIYDNFVWHTLF